MNSRLFSRHFSLKVKILVFCKKKKLTVQRIASQSERNRSAGRRTRSRRKTVQKIDHRRAFDGSVAIPHDEILYSHSGWTHFQITHPLLRSSSEETVAAILSTFVASAVSSDDVHLPQLSLCVEQMWKNHRRCRYTAILRQMLNRSSHSDAKNSNKLHVGNDRVYLFIRAAVEVLLLSISTSLIINHN